MPGLIPYLVRNARVCRTSQYLACRSAVLFPVAITKAAIDKNNGVKDVFNARDLSCVYMTAIKAWRSRLISLSKAGWPAVSALPGYDKDNESTHTKSGRFRFAYRANCPPFGVMLEGRRGRACKHARICPFCYARRVVLPVYAALEFACCNTDKALLHGLDLMALSYTQDGELTREKPAANFVYAFLDPALIANVCSRVSSGRGYIVASTVSPGESGKIIMRRTVFALVQRGFTHPKHKCELLDAASVTKKALVSLVSKHLKYPSGMLFGDAAIVVAIDAAAAKKRQFTSSGLLRNTALRSWERENKKGES